MQIRLPDSTDRRDFRGMRGYWRSHANLWADLLLSRVPTKGCVDVY